MQGDIVPSCPEFCDTATVKLLSCGFLSWSFYLPNANTKVIHLFVKLHPPSFPPSILPSIQRLFFVYTVPGTVEDAECPWMKNTQHFCQESQLGM